MSGVHQGYDPGADGDQDRYGDQRQNQAEEYPPEGDDGDREEDEDHSDRVCGLDWSLGDYMHLLLREGWLSRRGRKGISPSGNGAVAIRHQVGSMIPIADLSCPGPGLVVNGAVDAATSAAPCMSGQLLADTLSHGCAE
jgi:hypothetical protein